jgi:hypothetical protein
VISDPPGSEYRPKSRKPPKIPKIPKIPENPENPRKSRKSPKIPDSAIMRLGGLRLRLPLRHTATAKRYAQTAKAHCAYHGRLRQHPGPNYDAKPLHHHSASQDECLACRRHAKLKNHRIFIPVLKTIRLLTANICYTCAITSIPNYVVSPVRYPWPPQERFPLKENYPNPLPQKNLITTHEKKWHTVPFSLLPGA